MTDEAEPEEKDDDFGGFLTSLVIMIAVLAAVELFYRTSTLDPKLKKGWVFTAKQVDYETTGGDIVFTGNSRIYHAIQPKVIEATLQKVKGQPYTAYNFGIPSGSTPMIVMVASQLAHHNPRPKMFVIGTVPTYSCCWDELSLAGARAGMSWPAVPGLVKATWYTSPEDAGLAVFTGASRLIASRAEILYTIKMSTITPPVSFHDKGWYSMGGRVDPGVQDVRAKGRAIPYADNMDKSKGAIVKATPHREIAEAIEICQRAHIGVILMGAPQSRQLDWYHDEKHTYFEYIAEMKKLSEKYHVPWVDMNAPPVIQSSDFVDGDHLSDPGSEIFSKYVAEQIVAPNL